MTEYIPEPFQFETIDGYDIGWQTMNCFGLTISKKEEVRIVNFSLDNFKKLLKEKTISLPVKITLLTKGVAVINDPRIDESLYNDYYCQICCPMEFLPIQQRLRKSRQIKNKIVSYSKHLASNGCPEMIIESQEIKATTRKLSQDWTYVVDNKIM